MKCGMICQSHAAQLPVLNGRKCSMNQATFHSTFPIFLITKIFRYHKITNPAFLSCSGIKSTRNEKYRFEMLLDSGKLGAFSIECGDAIHTTFPISLYVDHFLQFTCSLEQ